MLAQWPVQRCNKLKLRFLRRYWRAASVGSSMRVVLRSAAVMVAAAAAAKTIGNARTFNVALHGVATMQGHRLLNQRRTLPGQVRRRATESVREAAIEKYQESENQVEKKAEEAAAPLAADDGRVLDASTMVGSVGAVVVGVALLPYPALVLYTAWSLATSGRLFESVTVQMVDGGLKFAPTALLGVLQGFSLVVVFGVVLWSITSSITRSLGLPAGPFGLLALSQDLAFTAVFIFAIAFGLDSLGPNENPMRGLSLSTTPDQVFAAAQKASKLAEKGAAQATKLSIEAATLAEKEQKELLAATAPQRKELDTAIADAQKKASEGLTDAQKKASESLSSAQTRFETKLKTLEGTSPGLSDKQVPDKDIPAKDAPTKDTPTRDAPTKDAPSKVVPAQTEVKDVPAAAASQTAPSKTSKS